MQTTLPDLRLTGSVQSVIHTTDIISLVPHADITSITNVHHSDAEGTTDAQNMQWREWSFVNSLQVPTYIQYPSSPMIPPSIFLPRISEYTSETEPTQTMERVHRGSRDFDSRLERQLEGSLGSLSTPIYELRKSRAPSLQYPSYKYCQIDYTDLFLS